MTASSLVIETHVAARRRILARARALVTGVRGVRLPVSRAGVRTTGLLAGLAAVNLTAHLGPWPAAVVIPVGAAILTGVAWATGLRLSDLGLSRASVRRGLRWALLAAAGAATVVAVALAIPATAEFFQDDRYAGLAEAARAALLTIPLTTVLPEELMFRGIFDGALADHLSDRAGYLVGAVAFGLWHVLSSLHLTSANAGLQQALGGGASGQLLGLAGAVLATSAAGVVFIWLRRKTGSVLAPIGLHWAINGLGALGAGAALLIG